MASRQTLKMRAAQAGEELRRTGQLVVRAPVLVRLAECLIRLLLGALLAGAELLDGCAPFGLGLVASCGSGLDGFCALLGACGGYLSCRGLVGGLRYVAAAILIYAVSFAFFDTRLYRKSWFMPLVAAVMDGITGTVALADRSRTPPEIIFFATELLLCGASAYFYRIAFTPWVQKREEEGLTSRQTVSLMILLGTLLLTLVRITFLGDLSLGRIAAALTVMTVGFTGGLSAGAVAGVACGVGMDLAAGGLPEYAMAYALSGVMAGVFHRQGRLVCSVAYVLANGLAVLWNWEQGVRISLLYEVFAASVLFLLLPAKTLNRLEDLLCGDRSAVSRERAQAYVRQRLEAAAEAFRGLYDSLRTTFSRPGINQGNAAIVFDRTADRVCRRCPLRSACWQRDYVSTFNALNDALPAMVERGRGEPEDFPDYFSGRCMKFREFLTAANEEVAALLCRRQYEARLRENRAAVCREYGALAEVMSRAADELNSRLTPDPVCCKRLKRHLAAMGTEPETAVCRDDAGHLRVELRGPGLAPLRTEQAIGELSKAVGLPLRAVGEQRRDLLVLVQAEPYEAIVGTAACQKKGQPVSGDSSAWFRTAEGTLCLLLCDGMGTGPEARQDSRLGIRLLEQFLQAGIRPEPALRTISSALALRGEETGGFTTIDLLCVNLFTGDADFYKYGAAPAYVKKETAVTKITGDSLPAGLAGTVTEPDHTGLRLEAGDCVLLATDGVTGSGSDRWLRDRLAAADSGRPGELAQQILAESGERSDAPDDRTVLVLRLYRK